MSPVSFVGAVLFCFQCRTAHAAMHGYGHSLSVASEASRKSLTKGFKEQEKTLKALVQGVYQGKKHLQELALEDYFEFDEWGALAGS
jgi:hypothetical protein